MDKFLVIRSGFFIKEYKNIYVYSKKEINKIVIVYVF